MAFAYDENFARVLRVDGPRVELAFDLDHARWPWLALHPRHLVLLEKYHYFGTLTGFWALSDTDPSLQTALTWIGWRFTPPENEALPTRGVCTHEREGERELLKLELFLESGEHVCTMDAVGVVFATRDYKAWRAGTRQKALEAGEALERPQVVRSGTAAVELGGPAFVSALREVEGKLVCGALVGTDAFHPRHPFHTGSGDHVNAGHLFDCAQQAAQLALAKTTPLRCRSGEATFARYVELDVPFEIHVEARAGHTVKLGFHQLGREAGTVELTFDAS